MHQHPRHPPRVSSPASSPQTNPTRSNNPREGSGAQVRVPPDSPRRGAPSSAGSGELESRGPSRESIRKLDQILQNLYVKAAVVVAQSRIKTTPLGPGKINKWFSLDTDEIEEFRNEFRTWKTCSAFEDRFPPMVIETYLDASQLSPSQCLVVVDDNGKRWDVLEALNSSETSDDSPTMRRRNTEVILERWRLELKPTTTDVVEDFGPILPTIYKKSIIFFRSLFVASRVIPAYKFSQQSMTKKPQPALEVKCRILTDETESSGYDALRQPLSDGRDVVTDYVLGDLEVPVGRFYASASYRNECHFRVDDAESLLSSRFMGVDEHFFKPSLPQSRDSSRRETSADIGSFPSRRHGRGSSDAQQTYGSLSTFHGAGAPGTSPISALRAIKPAGSDAGSPTGSVPTSVEEPSHSLPIRPSVRGNDGYERRTSVSFQPFKAGSLSGSPRPQDGEFPPSPSPLSGQRPSGLSALAQARKRNSLTAGMPASLRGGPPPAEIPVSSSPRPSSGRISSSFSHRRGRPSFGGQSRGGDDDQTSSGRQSLSSSVAQPGSGLLAEASGQTSSGSLNADDDNISEFLKVLDSKKTLSSFEPGKKGESATKRTVAQLSKFQHMRDSNNALTESLASSMQLQRSSSSSSRHLTSVPGMVAPNSMSVSSSPGKPLSPHTPHTPAIPSRLSENSIIDYEAQAQAARRATRVAPQIGSTEEESVTEVPLSPEGTTAIDIPLPLSPRIMQNNRRSSSVAQQHRAMVEEDDADLAFGGNRSISLGAEPTASTLFGMDHGESVEDSAGLQPAANIRISAEAGSPGSVGREKNPPSGLATSNTSSSPVRLRYRSTRGRPTPPQSSRGSFVGGSSGRYSTGRGDNDADDEPLVFDMQVSEMSRRSLEEGRGGGNVGSSSNDRYEPRGVSRRGW
ncbi:autophagy protein 13 [Cytospora paraplurivora]|uniref:Autophagy-related protein 13 n=1 Tax=Cytospora paraplurivora TaxID=2898453 RepID=A0AAN9YEF7_9PEZI